MLRLASVKMKPLVAAVLFVALAVSAEAAHAQTEAHAADPKATADALFREGERLFTAGEIASACKSFAESQRLDPALGTLMNLGLCHERQGKTATAFAELQSALAQAKARDHAERIRLLTEELAKLEPRLSRIRLVPPKGTPPKLHLDGVVLDPNAFDAPFPVDPGTHTLVLSTPRKRTATLTVTIAEGPAEQTVSVPELEDEAGVLAQTSPSASPSPEPTGGGRRIVTYSLLGLGVAGVGVGTAFGLVAMSEQDTAAATCTPGLRACASPEGVAANDAAHSAATISTIAFGVGLVAGLAGAYFVLTSPTPSARTQRTSPSVSMSARAFVLEGVW